MHWRKSSYSGGGDSDTCVEIADVHPAFTALIDHLKEHPWSEGRLPG
ncbi:DUF397 domain-containing protein [Streptomyces sp. NPDC005760]